MNLPPQPPLREVIARHGLDARKALGQHFLLDEHLCAKIARLSGDLSGRHVFEVGPGPGGLTRALLETDAASVTAIEIDPRACAVIEELRASVGPRLQLMRGDAVALDLAALQPAPRQIIANLPYNAATTMLVNWLHQAAAWESMTLMFQLEVAERICAGPGDAAYGRLAILAGLTCSTAIVLRLPPGAFSPPPAVYSAIVHFKPHAEQPAPELLAAIERLTAAGFNQRRKMLRVSLKPLGGQALLDAAGIDGQRRAETLALPEWIRLARLLMQGG